MGIKKRFIFKKYKFNLSYFFLISLSFVRMKYNQIETIRRVLVRKFKRHSFILCQLNSFFCFTKKKKNSRMGKGSGPLNSLEYIIKPGMVLFKILSYNYN